MSTRSPRLATLCAWINEHTDHTARLEPWTTNTDRKIGRLRSPGKGRKGHKLYVYAPGAGMAVFPVFTHESGETYRRNSEVVAWITETFPKAWKRHGLGAAS